MGRLENRIAIVTGAGQGIGRAIALGMAREGAALVIADLDEANAGAIKREIERVETHMIDATRHRSAADELFKKS